MKNVLNKLSVNDKLILGENILESSKRHRFIWQVKSQNENMLFSLKIVDLLNNSSQKAAFAIERL